MQTTRAKAPMKKNNILQFVLLGLMALSTAGAAEPAILIDGKDKGRIFDGIGALSAGASSRLLIDYPEPQRSEILDFLFKPNFGAALQINKVEIGGDMNSTDGSEPSHMRTRDDENYHRGYEWWLMVESKKRNPRIKLHGLQWGAPHWINPTGKDIWTQENITFLINWVRGAKTHHNLTIDYMGGWNERPGNPAWFVDFRKALDQNGMKHVQIVADDEFKWAAAKAMATHPEYAAAVQVIGSHYPDFLTGKDADENLVEALKTGKPLWGSEIGTSHYHDGAPRLIKQFNRGYIDSKMTAFINWATIWSVLSESPFAGCGLMLANTPWTGHYEVGKQIWATAHTTQFAQPGWQYLDRACGYFNGEPSRGSYVTLVSPDKKDYSVIVETLDAREPRTVTFTPTGGLSSGNVHVWKTNIRSKKTEDWFIKQASLTVKDGSFTATFEPGSLYTLTTTTGQTKGMTTPPSETLLALPYADDFQSYAVGATPKYLSDQHGTFEIVAAGGGRQGKSLQQMVTAKPVVWAAGDAPPASYIGDPLWKNYQVSCDVFLDQPGFASIMGRIEDNKGMNVRRGYHFGLNEKGEWTLSIDMNKEPWYKKLASGVVPDAKGKWHKLSVSFLDSTISASINGVVVVDKIVDTNYRSGMVGLQSGRWHTPQYMNFSVVPLGDDPYVRTIDNLAKTGAKVIDRSSQDPKYPAGLAIDGNPDTLWHTVWTPTPAPLPHYITIDLGKTRTLHGLNLTSRQDQSSSRVADCEVYVSDDTNQWGAPAASTKLNNEATPRTVRFSAPAAGRYMKIIIKSTHTKDSPNAAFAEIGIFE
jgi:hypothetical protein